MIIPPQPSASHPARPADVPDAALEAFDSEVIPRTRRTKRLRPSRAGGLVMLALGIIGVGLWGFRVLSATPPPTGTLIIDSDAPAEVQVDGVAHGTTPATLRLPAGAHALVVSREERTHEVMLTVRAGTETIHHVAWVEPSIEEPPVPAGEPLPESIPRATEAGPPPPAPAASPAVVAPARGSLVLSTPIPLGIYLDGRLIGVSEMSQIEIAPGDYSLQFVSEVFAFRTTQVVRIAANRTTTVTVAVPQVAVHVNATPWADVWIDGRNVGQTPIGDLLQPIGVHEVEFRHPQFGTKQMTVTVKASGVTRVAVDMRTP